MNRNDIYRDIEQTLGIVPEFLKKVPDSSLELEWNLFKQVQLAEGPVPNKYRELVGLGVAAVTRCPYCTLFHTEAARVHGASNDEIEDAVHPGWTCCRGTSGWPRSPDGDPCCGCPCRPRRTCGLM